MTSEQFTYWLRGFLEIADPEQLNQKQIQIIKDHLQLVLDKQTSNRVFTQLPQSPQVDIPYIHQPNIVCEDSDHPTTTQDSSIGFCSSEGCSTFTSNQTFGYPTSKDSK